MKQPKKDAMKKKAKKKVRRTRHARHHAHAHGAAPAHAPARPAKKHLRRKNPEEGMVLVPASMLERTPTENPARKAHGHHHPKKHHVKRHHPRKRNPGPETSILSSHSHVKDAMAAVGFGTVAAVAGLAGGYALSRANLRSKAANVVANVAAGAAIGGGLGMLDRAAGTVVTHNYMVAAGQWMMSDPRPTGSATMSASRTVPAKYRGGAAPRLMQRSASFQGADDVGGYEKLHGVVADNMGAVDEISAPDEIGATDEMNGFERLEGIVADNMGAADEFGDAEHMDGFDSELGDEHELGDEDVHGTDDISGLDYIAG